jgi:hypothetical protein
MREEKNSANETILRFLALLANTLANSHSMQRFAKAYWFTKRAPVTLTLLTF